MSFEWRLYTQLAYKLALETENKEAAYRSSISRAYYALFHLAKHVASEKGGYAVPKDITSVHAHLSSHFEKQMGHPHLASELRRMHRDRCIADYENDLPTTPNKFLDKAIARAEALQRLLSGI